MPKATSLSERTTLSRQAAAPPMLPAPTQPAVDLQANAQQAASLLKALANPDRLMLLCQMVDGERSVSELGELSGIGQPSLSQQLAVLRGERLVATRREGKHVLYRVDSPAVMAVLQTLHRLFCEPAPPPPRRRPVPASTRSRKVAA